MGRKKDGDILEIATRDVVTVPQTSTIMSVLKTMVTYRFRRIPVADAGNKRLMGLVVVMDIVNFLGGGEKYNIIDRKYRGKLSISVNEDVEEIMERKIVSVGSSTNWKDAIEKMISSRVNCLPVVDEREIVVGIITERDILKQLALCGTLGKSNTGDNATVKYLDNGSINSVITRKVFTIDPDITIGKAMESMVDKKLRRLPVVKDGVFLGLVTDRDIIRYFSKEAFKDIFTGDISEILEKPIKFLLSKDILIHKNPLIFDSNARASEVANEMLKMNYGAALIVEGGNLEGIVTERDLMKVMAELS